MLQSTHHFLHSHQLASDKLHDDFMERCTLAKSLNPWSHGISLDLFLCRLPLCFCLGKFAILRLCLIILLRQHLQFQYITMFGCIMGKKKLLLQQTIIILLTNIIVWNTQYQHITEGILYGKHTIIEQQTGECLRISQPTGRECLFQGCHNLPRLSYRTDDTLAVAIQLIQLKKFLHFIIISPRVWIYHQVRCLSIVHIISEIINDHITIEHLALSFQSFLGETIVIIPRLHLVYHHLDITCCRNAPHLFIISKHLAYFFQRKA